jgi:hypothetical protein
MERKPLGEKGMILQFPDLLFYDYEHWALSLGSEQ